MASEIKAREEWASPLGSSVSIRRECSLAVACATVHQAVKEGHADPEILENLEQKIRQAMWFPEYLPIRYEPSPVIYRDVVGAPYAA